MMIMMYYYCDNDEDDVDGDDDHLPMRDIGLYSGGAYSPLLAYGGQWHCGVYDDELMMIWDVAI